jgi:hypothetical protein
MGRRGRRGKRLLDILKEKRGFWKLKGKELNRFLWSTHFRRGNGPVVIETTGRRRKNLYIYIYIYRIHAYKYILKRKYIRTYLHAYIHTYLHIYMYTYIHTYTYTCIHTYIHTYMYLYVYVRTVFLFLVAVNLNPTPATSPWEYCW